MKKINVAYFLTYVYLRTSLTTRTANISYLQAFSMDGNIYGCSK